MQKNSLISRSKVVLHFHEAPLVPIKTTKEYYVLRHLPTGKFLNMGLLNLYILQVGDFISPSDSENFEEFTWSTTDLKVAEHAKNYPSKRKKSFNKPSHAFNSEEIEIVKVRESTEVIFIKEMI